MEDKREAIVQAVDALCDLGVGIEDAIQGVSTSAHLPRDLVAQTWDAERWDEYVPSL